MCLTFEQSIYCFDVFESEKMFEEQEAEMQGIQGSFVKYYEFEQLQPEQYQGKGLDHVFAYDHDFRSCQNQRK